MSRIWKLPIKIKSNVKVSFKEWILSTSSDKWNLALSIPQWIALKIENEEIFVSIEDVKYKKLWGLIRTLINNNIVWLSDGFEKKLVVFWVWYNTKIQWKKLILNLWYSHSIEFDIPEWITITTEKDPKWSDILTIKWFNKQLVWETASKIIALRKVEPYKWKWIRYINQIVKLKQWKTAKK